MYLYLAYLVTFILLDERCICNGYSFHFHSKFSPSLSSRYLSSIDTKPSYLLRNSHGILHKTKNMNSRLYSSSSSNIKIEQLPKIDFLISLWEKISFPNPDESKNELKLKDYGLNRKTVQSVLNHFQSCKDCAAEDTILIATQDDQQNDMIILSFGNFKIFSDNPEDNDEIWEDIDESFFGPDDPNPNDLSNFITFRDEKDDEKVLDITKLWVKKMIADFNICPFTMDSNKAGIPAGGVRYRVSRAITAEEAFYRYWEEVRILLSKPEKEIATTLLIFPQLELFGNFELFECYCESLNEGLTMSSIGLEEDIQLLFFHPKYQFRDGMARVGIDQGAANYARKSPWPMINILRTSQVRTAQKGILTGQVYKQNEDRLSAVGTKSLQDMLHNCDWSALPAISTNVKLEQIKQAIERGKQLQLAEEKEMLIKQSIRLDVRKETKGIEVMNEDKIELESIERMEKSSKVVCPFDTQKSSIGESIRTTTNPLDIQYERDEKVNILTSESTMNVKSKDPRKVSKEEENVSKEKKQTKNEEEENMSMEDLLQFVEDVERWIESNDPRKNR